MQEKIGKNSLRLAQMQTLLDSYNEMLKHYGAENRKSQREIEKFGKPIL